MSPFLGVNVSMASVEEMKQRGLLEEGEILLALFDGTLLDEQRRRIGGLALADFVALTDRRLILWARGFFNDTVDGFPWSDVDVVRAETWDPWHGRVSLALRIPATPPRKRRVALGEVQDAGQPERVIINTLDYMPVEDVDVLAKMVAWVGDQVLAGLSGEELVKAFEAEFPAVERKPLPPFFLSSEPAPPPPPEPEPAQPKKKRWWKFGSKAEEEETKPVSPGNLIAAYERQRGAPASASPAPTAPVGPLPTLPEQPNMYEVSRSLRLMLEVPRGLARGMRRASEILSGATELLNNMQDPRVRRNAMRGLYYAAARQEAEGGPLAPVGPVVRAAVRFAEPTEQQPAQEPTQRRITVRAAVRQPASAPTPDAEPSVPQPSAPETPPASNNTQPVRRSISIRRAEPPAAENGTSTPVRRIVVSRTDRPATVNGSGATSESHNGTITDSVDS